MALSPGLPGLRYSRLTAGQPPPYIFYIFRVYCVFRGYPNSDCQSRQELVTVLALIASVVLPRQSSLQVFQT